MAALRARLDAAGITGGLVFRHVRKGGRIGERLTDRSVALIVKAGAVRVAAEGAGFTTTSKKARVYAESAFRLAA